MVAPLTAACIALAATTFGVAQPALWMILKTEGGRIGQCTTQPNGLHDCGPAQVNIEIWAPHFAGLLHQPVNVVVHALRDDGCFNIEAAAYILRAKIEEAHGDAWDGIGRYNSARPALKHAYQQKLIEAFRALYPQAGSQAAAGTPSHR